MQYAKVTALGGLLAAHDQWRVADLASTYSRVALGGDVVGELRWGGRIGHLRRDARMAHPILSHPGADTEFTEVTGTRPPHAPR